MMMKTRGLSLIEVVIAMTVLVVVLMGVGVSLTASLNASRDAKPALVAQEAGRRVIEELRNRDFTIVHDSFWGSAAKKSFGGKSWVVADTQGVLQMVADEHLVPAFDSGVMGPSSTGAAATNGDPLRLRFLGESEFHALWGTQIDIDYPANPAIQVAPTATQKVYPVLVQVHYRDGTGDRVYQVGALIQEEAPLDR